MRQVAPIASVLIGLRVGKNRFLLCGVASTENIPPQSEWFVCARSPEDYLAATNKNDELKRLSESQ